MLRYALWGFPSPMVLLEQRIPPLPIRRSPVRLGRESGAARNLPLLFGHPVGAGFTTSRCPTGPSVPSPGRQCSGPPTPAADPAVSGNGRVATHVGSARVYRRWFSAAHRTPVSLWLSICRSVFVERRARADGADRLTDALASWTMHLWHPPAEGTESPLMLTCYVDGHRKPVYSDVLLPRGLIGRLGVILGCRTLLLLHDEQGHPLFVTTHRGDQHLTAGVPAFLVRYEQHVEHSQVTRMIVDREGMATKFLARLHAETGASKKENRNIWHLTVATSIDT